MIRIFLVSFVFIFNSNFVLANTDCKSVALDIFKSDKKVQSYLRLKAKAEGMSDDEINQASSVRLVELSFSYGDVENRQTTYLVVQDLETPYSSLSIMAKVVTEKYLGYSEKDGSHDVSRSHDPKERICHPLPEKTELVEIVPLKEF